VSKILVVHKNGRLLRRWRRALEAAGHVTVGSSTLAQGLTAMANTRLDGLVIELTCGNDVEMLRRVAALRELPALVVVTDDELGSLPVPARAQAATLLSRDPRPQDLVGGFADLQHALAQGETSPQRQPFRLPPARVRKWTIRLRTQVAADAGCDATLPDDELAA